MGKRAHLTIAVTAVLVAVFAFLYYGYSARPTGTEQAQAPEEKAPAAKPLIQVAHAPVPQAPAAERAPASVAPADLPRPEETSHIGDTFVHKSALRVIETLASSETAPSGDGTRIRTQIVRAHFKYPLVRIEEQIAPTGEPVARREMVADHVIVQLQEGATISDLQSLLSRQGGFSAQIRKATDVVGSPGTELEFAL